MPAHSFGVDLPRTTWGYAAAPSAGDAPVLAPSTWGWALRLLGLAPAVDATAAARASAAAPLPMQPPTDASRPVPLPAPAGGTPREPSLALDSRPARTADATASGSMPVRRLSASGSIRRSAIPAIEGGRASLTVATGMSTYRQVVARAGQRERSIVVPAARRGAAAQVEVFAVQPHRSRRHATQVLVPVTGTRVTIPAGSEVRFVVRLTGRSAGRSRIDAGVATITARVADTQVRPLPMLAWVNPSSARARGATVEQVERTLASFGVASTGARTGGTMPRRYVSAAWEAATKQPIGPVVDRILADERALARSSPGSAVWVQVSDEQDATAAEAAATARWIARLDRELERRGSRAKLFVACQPRPHTMSYAPHVDGWAVTQSSAGMTRTQSLAAVRDAAARTGRRIETMEYPGNAFFDARTPGGAALSTASAALDGAGAWFIYSANNLDVLEAGRGVEGRGDIGGLVAIRRGSVLPTLALAEADYGANLGAAARVTGGDARRGAAARSVAAAARSLDDYRHRGAPDFAAWERTIASRLRD